jgi:hypothetical protein
MKQSDREEHKKQIVLKLLNHEESDGWYPRRLFQDDLNIKKSELTKIHDELKNIIEIEIVLRLGEHIKNKRYKTQKGIIKKFSGHLWRLKKTPENLKEIKDIIGWKEFFKSKLYSDLFPTRKKKDNFLLRKLEEELKDPQIRPLLNELATGKERPLRFIKLRKSKKNQLNKLAYLEDKYLFIDLREDETAIFPRKSHEASSKYKDVTKTFNSIILYPMEIFSMNRGTWTFELKSPERMKALLQGLRSHKHAGYSLKIYIINKSNFFIEQFDNDVLFHSKRMDEEGLSLCLGVPEDKIEELKSKYPEVYKELKKLDPDFSV